eukprot:2044305-Rhodomonas_salina.1
MAWAAAGGRGQPARSSTSLRPWGVAWRDAKDSDTLCQYRTSRRERVGQQLCQYIAEHRTPLRAYGLWPMAYDL